MFVRLKVKFTESDVIKLALKWLNLEEMSYSLTLWRVIYFV